MLPEKAPADLEPKPGVNGQLVALLEKTLAEAKAGEIIGAALVVVDPMSNTGTKITFPPQLACIIVGGCEFMKNEIISIVNEQRRRGPAILRAAGMPTRQ